MRLIDADELRKCAIPCEIHNGALTDLCVPLYQIDNAPTVDIPCNDCCADTYRDGYEKGKADARLTGEWKEKVETKQLGYGWLTAHEIVCSVCGKEAEWLDGGSQLLSKFCPNCGAKMGGEEP